MGHAGSDGSNPGSRLNAHGDWQMAYSENIDYGPLLTGRDVIIDLLVDDGVPDRGHRHNILIRTPMSWASRAARIHGCGRCA